jgi:hypothetical protein
MAEGCIRRPLRPASRRWVSCSDYGG